MHGRRLPQDLTPPARLGPALLLGWAVGALAQPTLDLPSLAPPPAPSTLVQQALPVPGRNTIGLDVPPQAEGYLGFSELRTTAALSAIALVDPSGRTVWRRAAQELRRLPSAEAKQPALGDVYALPPGRNPAPGRWQLVVERQAADTGPARILFSYRVSTRYTLALWTQPAAPAAGQLQLLTLRAFDMGDPVALRPTLAVQVLDNRGQTVASMTAEPSLPTPSGPQPVTEPGVVFAQWQPAMPGSYRIQARWQASPAQAPLLLTKEVSVPASEAQLRFLVATPELASQCVQAIALGYELRLTKPPAPGATHVLHAQLSGPLGSRQISMPAEFSGLVGSARVRVPAATLRTFGWPQLRIESSRLMRFTPDLKLLVAGPVIDLGTAWPRGAALCP